MSDLLNRIFLTEPIDTPLTRLSLRTIVPADTLRTLGLLIFGNTNELVTLRNIVVLHGVGHSERRCAFLPVAVLLGECKHTVEIIAALLGASLERDIDLTTVNNWLR